MRKIVLFIGLVALVGWGVMKARDPYRTALPMNATDLSQIESSLNKLAPVDRELVLAYLKRSKGDVLPVQFADPDNPLTAKTFAEAIKLQKEFESRRAKEDEKAKLLRAEQDQLLAPLRGALAIELIRREIVSKDALYGVRGTSGMEAAGVAKAAINDSQVLVTTYRVTNTSSNTINEIKASIKIHREGDALTELGSLDSCYITHNDPLPMGASFELSCANVNKSASPADRDYVELPVQQLVLDWKPKHIIFSNGTELKYDGY